MRGWGPGPVFVYEWLTTARRWQVYAVRSFFVAALLGALGVVWVSEVSRRGLVTFADLARVGESFFEALAGTQLALVLMTAPAATAGSICQDKARGTLAHLLVTDLSNAEIVLGKLAARLVPALGLVACALPVTALGALLGGIDPLAVTGSFLVALGVAVLGAALALALSVWALKTHEVLMATYAAWAVWLLAKPIWKVFLAWGGVGPPAWLDWFNPFLLTFAPYMRPGTVSLVDYVVFLGACLLLSTVLACAAVLRVRAVAVRQFDRRQTATAPGRLVVGMKRQVRWWPSPSLDGNPVLWREWHRNRPSRWARVLGRLYFALAALFTALAIGQAYGWGGMRELSPWVNALQVSIGLLFVAVVAGTSLAEERARGSLDVLLATPLTTRSILWGKWWGTYRAVLPLAVLPGLLAYALAWRYTDRWYIPYVLVGLILAYGAAVGSLGLALATWTARLGRAVALTVTAYVLVTVGWFCLVMVLSNRSVHWQGVAEASPFFGPGELTSLIERSAPDPMMHTWVRWAGAWIAVYVTVAFLLFLATLATFDRCLGRASETPRALSAPRKNQRVPKPRPVVSPR